MNEIPNTQAGKRSTFARFFRWLFSWPTVRRALVSMAVFATLIALLVTEEDWRGKHARDNYQRQLEAQGEKFDWESFVPPSVPDDQNFFKAPIFTNLFNGTLSMSILGTDGRYPKDRGNWPNASMTDLRAWQNYYRHPVDPNLANEFPIAPEPQTPAVDVLLALSKYDPAIEELRQASLRPYSNIPLDYQDGFNGLDPLFKDMAVLKRCSQVLQLRAIAELADGQSDKALDDVQLILRLSDSLRSSPFLISHLVRIAITFIAIQPIWEGLAQHKWSDEQLVVLNAELAKENFLADYEITMRGERAFAVATFENQRITREIVISQGPTNKPVITSLRFMPSAYFYQSELAYDRVIQEWVLPIVDTNAWVISPEMLRQFDVADHAALKHYSLYRVQALMMAPALATAAKKDGWLQTSIDLARVACALERYHLMYGVYPSTLDMLSPYFIDIVPHDIINGQPLHYRRTADGKFVLYSVGWNERDDGGKVILYSGGMVNLEASDWVWKY